MAVSLCLLVSCGLSIQALSASAAVADPRAIAAATRPLQAEPAVSGTITDASGAAVVGARVVVEVLGSPPGETRTSDSGQFRAALPSAGTTVLTVSAPGFADAVMPVNDRAVPLLIVLQAAGVAETVTVTATRGVDTINTPASAVVVSSATLINTAGGAVDDKLRSTPGFGLTRRSSSRVANPSTQGVSMRGLPGNAGSRTLVLADGFPLNDPFGGWVYWNRIPEAALERVEVVRGSTGDLYGGDAVSGVIQLLTFGSSRPQLRASFDVADPRTSRASIFGAARRGPIALSLATEWVATDGVPTVAAAERGPIDVNATSRYRTGFATFGYERQGWTMRVRGSAYRERRGNGTPLVVNRTNWHQVSADGSGRLAGGTLLLLAGWGEQDYYNNFSSVPANRASERVTSEQWLPSRFASAGAQWARPWKGGLVLLGSDTKRTRGNVDEYRFDVSGTRSGPYTSGGIERNSSLYGRLVVALRRSVTLVAGLRGDFWRSVPTESNAARHAINFFSPRLSLSWQARTTVAVHASVTHAYRTPTLDELHRSSQVGNTATLNNPQLNPEVLTGLEAGLLVSLRRASWRATTYWNNLTDAVTNVTISTTPTLITKQKQNADSVRAKGVEIEGDYRPWSALTVTGSVVATSSRYRHVTSLPALEGNRVPQIPVAQAGLGATYVAPRVATVAAQWRFGSTQFEDDLNTLRLASYHVVDLTVTRGIGRAVRAFVAIENLLDTEIQTGRTPVTKIGWPRMTRIGIRVALP